MYFNLRNSDASHYKYRITGSYDSFFFHRGGRQCDGHTITSMADMDGQTSGHQQCIDSPKNWRALTSTANNISSADVYWRLSRSTRSSSRLNLKLRRSSAALTRLCIAAGGAQSRRHVTLPRQHCRL